MGRTLRRRAQKKRTVVSLSSDPCFIRLIRWMTERGWKQTCSLNLARFSNTGRGLMAKHYIGSGNTIVSIPKSLLITAATVCNSQVGLILSTGNLKQTSFLCQEVLAAFLLWEKHLGNESFWFQYIETLPVSFSIPHVLDKWHIDNFPWFLKDQALNALEMVQNCYSHLMHYFKDKICNHCKLLATDVFLWDDFLWGWCCVNTRAIYIDPEKVPFHTLPLSDRNCLALAPYLDMFNHCDIAEVEAGMNMSNDFYEIKTLKPVQKFKEVFINYGPHSNAKLFLEYGFVLPSNVQDTIPVCFSLMVIACEIAGLNIQNKYEKIKFCENHGLITQLYLSNTGLSWNCSVLLQVLLCTSADPKCWEQIAFKCSEILPVCDTRFANVKTNIFNHVRKELTISQNLLHQKCSKNCCMSLREGKKNLTLEMCWQLIQGMLSILDLGTENASSDTGYIL